MWTRTARSAAHEGPFDPAIFDSAIFDTESSEWSAVPLGNRAWTDRNAAQSDWEEIAAPNNHWS